MRKWIRTWLIQQGGLNNILLACIESLRSKPPLPELDLCSGVCGPLTAQPLTFWHGLAVVWKSQVIVYENVGKHGFDLCSREESAGAVNNCQKIKSVKREAQCAKHTTCGDPIQTKRI